MTDWQRRRLLVLAAASAGSAFWPGGALLAQSSPGALLRAPKSALVIGNSRYRQAPLRNPPNDARGIAAVLEKCGFSVTLGTELGRADMQGAIRSHAAGLASRQAVGLFYFAGHGAQLAWRNYLLPVDAEIGTVEELRDRGVDVNGLIDGIRRAGNPMNIIILDACRDNPFGSTTRLEQKGLSQLDAPPGTLLAYATAPGNVAIDGTGEHGLYTEHLLREIGVPEAKVEDVFKRVRLAVRRRSHGRQVPWESTSLEQDFWFVPQAEVKKLADDELERAFRTELAHWEKIQDTARPEPFEEYLREHPSGRFSELAQLRLDRLLAQAGEQKIEAVSAPGNPFTKGTIAADTAYKVGDTYRYRQFDLLTKLERKPIVLRVTAITDREIVYNKGLLVTDLLGNTLKAGKGAVWSPNQTSPQEFSVGRRWNTRFSQTTPRGQEGVIDLDLRIAAREEVAVPAGTFNAYRVEATGWRTGEGPQIAWDWKTWYAPDRCRRPVAAEVFNRNAGGEVIVSVRRELVAFHQS